MDNFKNWARFWREVVVMWATQHGINLSLVWKMSPFITVIGIIGIVTFPQPWRTVALIILILGASILILSLCFIFPYKKWKRDMDIMGKSHTKTINALTNQIDELSPLRALEREQRGHEGDWLHLVTQSIDLQKSINTPERQITVKFNFDSGLVYDFKPYRIWVTPMLEGYIPVESQYEMKQVPNFLRGKRSQLSSIPITIKDDKLWELINKARQGEKFKKGLKVEIQPKIGEPVISFTDELARH